ncbi:MAG TPA: hypothetical protein DEQ01_06045 [Thermoanaerobacter sp.]|nr:hypothetical protein [Thermoanaerobacter sp.]
MKTSKEVLLESIKEDLLVYLKSGKLSPLPFLNELNLNINKVEDSLKIHFLLMDEVKDYILNLPMMIRELKVSTNLTKEISYNKIRGSIDWKETIRQRLNTNYKDKTLFSYNERNKLYNTKENVVLKKFIEVLYDIVIGLNMDRFTGYDWYVEGEKINKIVKEIYEKNVYMSRINIEGINVTDRMIEDVAKNRSKLYSDAAKLLRKYRQIINFIDYEEIKKLFEKTFIEIADENTLFELYWVVRILRDNACNEKMYIVDGTNNKIASWEDGNLLYNIYHNSTGSDNLIFKIGFEEVENIENEYFRRMMAVVKKTHEIADKLFEDKGTLGNIFWSGRPDIIIEIIDKNTGRIVKVILGEVKYTTDREYMIQGLKELLEYVYYIKEKSIKGMYVFDNPQSGIEVEGILFVDNIDFKPLHNEIVKVYGTDTKEILL